MSERNYTPTRCPVCGKAHADKVTLACWACIVADVEDTGLIEPPVDEGDTQPMPVMFEDYDDEIDTLDNPSGFDH